MIGMVLSIGLPSWPWQPAPPPTFLGVSWGSAGPALAFDNAASITPQEINQPNMPPNVHLCVRSGKSQQKRGRNRPRSCDHNTTPASSIDRESDDVVAALEVDLDVTARADHDILLAAQRVAGGRRIDARPGAEAPQFLAGGRVVGRKLAVAFPRENKATRGGENAADHRLRRLHLPFDLASVVVDGGDVARLLLARDGGEGAAQPQLAVRIGRAFDTAIRARKHAGPFLGRQNPHVLLRNHGLREADQAAVLPVVNIDVTGL